MSRRERIVSVAERTIDADPTAVWSLVANPERIAEWAGFVLVGYMGTELPSPGHNVFILPKRRLYRGRPRRVEIEAWDAGAGIRCVVHTEPEPTRFELTIHPEVQPEAIATRVRLVQRSQVPAASRLLAQWWVERSLADKIERIGKAVET